MNGARTGMARLAAGVLCLTLATITAGAGPAGAAAASTAPATPAAPPVITVKPTSRTVPPGGNVTFYAATAGQATVRWQRSTDGGATWVDLPGQTSTALGLAAVTVAQNGHQFRAVFTDPDGSTATPAATLTVREQWTIVVPTTRPATPTPLPTNRAPVAPRVPTSADADPVEPQVSASADTSAVEPPVATTPRVITVRPQASADPVVRRAPQGTSLAITAAALFLGAVAGLTGGILIGRRRRSGERD